MFKKAEWKKEIFAEDLKKVILVGLLMTLFGAILADIVGYLFSLINVNISFGVLIYAALIGIFIKKSYVNYHILYPTLGLLFMILAGILSRLFYPFIIYLNFSDYFNYLAMGKSWLYIFFGPIYNLATRFGADDYILTLFGFIIHIFAYFVCYKLAKGKN